MYNAGTASPANRCAYICVVLLFSLGFSLGTISIVWLAIGSNNDGVSVFVTMGIIFLITAAVMITLGIGICYRMKKKHSETPFPQGPIVSGSAPPGPVSGFHVQPANQGMYQPQGAYYPQPSAPHPQPVGAYPSQLQPHDPSPSRGFDAMPPPSYDDVVK